MEMTLFLFGPLGLGRELDHPFGCFPPLYVSNNPNSKRKRNSQQKRSREILNNTHRDLVEILLSDQDSGERG